MRFIYIRLKPLTLTLMLITVTILVISYNFHSSTRPSLVKAEGTYYMVHTQEKVIALTFDDGPDPLFTGSILDVLKAKQVKATFFVLGENAEQNPELLQRIAVEGHEIGNHGYSHSYKSQEFLKELELTNEVIFNSLKINTKYYRPPGGIVSNKVIEGTTKNNHILTLWSIDSKDWQNPGPTQIVRNVMKTKFPGAIILLHDGGEKREQTAQALGLIIDQLRNDGYRFVSVSELRNFETGLPVEKLK